MCEVYVVKCVHSLTLLAFLYQAHAQTYRHTHIHRHVKPVQYTQVHICTDIHVHTYMKGTHTWIDACTHAQIHTHTHRKVREICTTHTSAPIMTGVPSSSKCLSNSLPVLPISAPLGTLVMREVTPRRWFKTILTSNEPIHCLEPKKDDSLSPTSINTCIKQRTLYHASSLSTPPTSQ